MVVLKEVELAAVEFVMVVVELVQQAEVVGYRLNQR